MTGYDKDLARILVEGTKVVYGSDKSTQLQSEFERQRRQPVYRGNAEELTSILERVCSDAEVSQLTPVQVNYVESIDNVVESNSSKPSMLKVAAKGTLNLVNKTCWYYPILGALPGKYQVKIAKKLGDDPGYYTLSNMAAELVVASIAGYYMGNIPGALALGSISFGHSTLRFLTGLITEDLGTVGRPGRQFFSIGLAYLTPLYATLYSILAVKAAPKVIASTGQKIKNIYVSTYKQEQERLLRSKTILKRIEELPVKVRVEPQPEIVEEEFDGDEEAAEQKKKLAVCSELGRKYK